MSRISKELQRLVVWLREDGRPEALDAAAALSTMASKYNWSGKKSRPWTTKEIKFLTQNCMTMTRIQLAAALGRSENAVNNQMTLKKIGRKYQEAT